MSSRGPHQAHAMCRRAGALHIKQCLSKCALIEPLRACTALHECLSSTEVRARALCAPCGQCGQRGLVRVLHGLPVLIQLWVVAAAGGDGVLGWPLEHRLAVQDVASCKLGHVQRAVQGDSEVARAGGHALRKARSGQAK